MCPPALIAAISAGVSAVGQGVSALQASASARYQAQIADRNAALENEAGRNAADNGRKQALSLYRKIGQTQGQQAARMAANGVDLNFGSPLQVQRDTAAMGNEDVRSLYDQTAQNVRSFDINAANYGAQAQGARQAATGALVGGVFDIGKTILGGVDQYRLKKGHS